MLPVAGMLMQVAPEQAQSNLSKWYEIIGGDSPSWLAAPGIDHYGYVLFGIALLCWVALLIDWIKRRRRKDSAIASLALSADSEDSSGSADDVDFPTAAAGNALHDVLALLDHANELYSRYVENRRTTLTVYDSVVWENALATKLPLEKKTRFRLLTQRMRHEYEPDTVEDVKKWAQALVNIAQELQQE